MIADGLPLLILLGRKDRLYLGIGLLMDRPYLLCFFARGHIRIVLDGLNLWAFRLKNWQ